MRVTVLWLDTATIDEWIPRDDAIKEVCSIVESTGWLLEDNSEYLILCHSKGRDGQVCGVLIIPKGCVVEVEK